MIRIILILTIIISNIIFTNNLLAGEFDNWIKKNISYSTSVNFGLSRGLPFNVFSRNINNVPSSSPYFLSRNTIEYRNFYYIFNVNYGFDGGNNYLPTAVPLTSGYYVWDYFHVFRYRALDLQFLGLGYKKMLNNKWTLFFDITRGKRRYYLDEYKIGNGNLLFFDYKDKYLSPLVIGTEEDIDRLLSRIQDRSRQKLTSFSLGVEYEKSSRFNYNLILRYDRSYTPLWLPFNGEYTRWQIKNFMFAFGVKYKLNKKK
jgi:hypothetical protein